ncbi:MAG: helix-turn-helix domain-containing protein, partial [Armatimonadota bacterium]
MDGHLVWQEVDSAHELWYRYQSETVSELRPRWHALWLLRQGYTRHAVSQALGINPRTL